MLWYDIRRMRYILVLASLQVVFGCGAAAQGVQGPCSLVTKAEVQEAAGVAVNDCTLDPINKSVCHFKVGATGSDISLLVTSKRPEDSAEKTVTELKKRKIAATVVPGIGDGAYSASPGYGMQQLGLYKGSKHVVVTVFLMGAPEAKAKAAAEAVARKALART